MVQGGNVYCNLFLGVICFLLVDIRSNFCVRFQGGQNPAAHRVFTSGANSQEVPERKRVWMSRFTISTGKISQKSCTLLLGAILVSCLHLRLIFNIEKI